MKKILFWLLGASEAIGMLSLIFAIAFDTRIITLVSLIGIVISVVALYFTGVTTEDFE